MTEAQRLFLVQARSNHTVYKLLRGQEDLPACHLLHYLQMATELLGKARSWKHGPNISSHRAFVGFLKSLETNRRAQRGLGYEGKNAKWAQVIRKSHLLAERIEELAPALSLDGPNPEYPWPRDDPRLAPAEHRFSIWQDLSQTSDGRQFLELLARLFDLAEAFL